MRNLLITLLIISILGCASKGETKLGEIEIPSWYLTTESDPNYILGKATATSEDLQLAIDKAKHDARLDIAENLESHIMGLIKKFDEEVGKTEDAELLSQFTKVSKNVVDQTLIGTKERKVKIAKEGTGYRAFVLMELPIGKAKEELLKQLYSSENTNLYTRFRASQSFQELKEEIEKLREYKKEEEEGLKELNK
ncbi:MAG: hypothetical protein ABIN61_05030 [candidate division WOR-3 bacterium]